MLCAGRSTRDVLCRYHMHGACNRGTSCPFSHDLSKPQSMVCKYWLAGHCSYGANCRYDHVRTTYAPKQQPRQSRWAAHGAGAPEDQHDGWDALDGFAQPSASPELDPAELAERPLCGQFQSSGQCARGQRCPLVHGLLCQVCGRFALHPYSEEASVAHTADCQGRHARLASIAASQEVECGICYERVMGKLRPGERRFGLLACEHPFCLACIRGWRSHTDGGADIDNAVRTCPVCRQASWFVTPSSVWPSNQAERLRIIEAYKTRLKTIDCRHFDSGEGRCPFGTSCFYKHAYRDGSLEEPTKLRHLAGGDEDVKIMRKSMLSDFFDMPSAVQALRTLR
eukprot:jgi/Astpho2/2939/e_gw1.00050.135.1_t